jgi:hypothetical protein
LAFISVYLLAKHPRKFSNTFTILLLFLLGFFLSPLVTGAIFYPQPFSFPIDFTIPFLIIPSLIATSVYIRVTKTDRVKISLFFLYMIFAIVVGMLFAMPFGPRLPESPLIKLEINRTTMVANVLIDYLKNVLVPTILCFLYAKFERYFFSIFLLFLIPFALGFLYNFTAILTGGVV